MAADCHANRISQLIGGCFIRDGATTRMFHLFQSHSDCQFRFIFQLIFKVLSHRFERYSLDYLLKLFFLTITWKLDEKHSPRSTSVFNNGI